MALGGNPGVHFAVLVYHLALIIDHDGAVAGGFVALQLKDDAKDAPDLQAGRRPPLGGQLRGNPA